jgi:hypothetical protein
VASLVDDPLKQQKAEDHPPRANAEDTANPLATASFGAGAVDAAAADRAKAKAAACLNQLEAAYAQRRISPECYAALRSRISNLLSGHQLGNLTEEVLTAELAGLEAEAQAAPLPPQPRQPAPASGPANPPQNPPPPPVPPGSSQPPGGYGGGPRGGSPGPAPGMAAGSGGARDRWFYAHQRQKCGPVALTQIQKLVADGTLPSEVMVLREGTQKWASLQDVMGPAAPAAVLTPPPPVAGAGETANPLTEAASGPKRGAPGPSPSMAAGSAGTGNRWFYEYPRNTKCGPVPLAEIQAMVAKGNLPDSVMVLCEGAKQWLPLQAAIAPVVPATLVSDRPANTTQPDYGTADNPVGSGFDINRIPIPAGRRKDPTEEYHNFAKDFLDGRYDQKDFTPGSKFYRIRSMSKKSRIVSDYWITEAEYNRIYDAWLRSRDSAGPRPSLEDFIREALALPEEWQRDVWSLSVLTTPVWIRGYVGVVAPQTVATAEYHGTVTYDAGGAVTRYRGGGEQVLFLDTATLRSWEKVHVVEATLHVQLPVPPEPSAAAPASVAVPAAKPALPLLKLAVAAGLMMMIGLCGCLALWATWSHLQRTAGERERDTLKADLAEPEADEKKVRPDEPASIELDFDDESHDNIHKIAPAMRFGVIPQTAQAAWDRVVEIDTATVSKSPLRNAWLGGDVIENKFQDVPLDALPKLPPKREPVTLVMFSFTDLYIESLARQYQPDDRFRLWVTGPNDAINKSARLAAKGFCFDRIVLVFHGNTGFLNLGPENPYAASTKVSVGLRTKAWRYTEKGVEHKAEGMVDVHWFFKQLLHGAATTTADRPRILVVGCHVAGDNDVEIKTPGQGMSGRKFLYQAARAGCSVGAAWESVYALPVKVKMKDGSLKSQWAALTFDKYCLAHCDELPDEFDPLRPDRGLTILGQSYSPQALRHGLCILSKPELRDLMQKLREDLQALLEAQPTLLGKGVIAENLQFIDNVILAKHLRQ